MADLMQQNMVKMEERKIREVYDRLTAVSHLQVEHFSKHQKLEGYYEYADMGNIFQCDRLLKFENMFARVQMGYNPNRGYSFIFANIKTSRYDTAASRHQREMKEYQMKALIKGENANKAFVARRQSNTSILIEKTENKPWSEESVEPYLGRVNMETLQKTMPFLSRRQEIEELNRIRMKRIQVREEIAANSRKSEHEENVALNREERTLLRMENSLESISQQKDMKGRYFLRRLNYAFDIQKHEMFQYYKDQRMKAVRQTSEAQQDDQPEDEEKT